MEIFPAITGTYCQLFDPDKSVDRHPRISFYPIRFKYLVSLRICAAHKWLRLASSVLLLRTEREDNMKQHFLMQGVELVAIGESTAMQAQKRVTGCAKCSPLASAPFESLLHTVLGNNGMTEFFLCCPARCPKCGAAVFEKTLVDFDGAEPRADVVDIEFRYFDARDENQDVVFIDEPLLLDAESFIGACEDCCEQAEVPFDQLLDSLTGCDPTTTEYVICHAAKCATCHHDVTEKTLIVPR